VVLNYHPDGTNREIEPIPQLLPDDLKVVQYPDLKHFVDCESCSALGCFAENPVDGR
jgi:hypothetical protein